MTPEEINDFGDLLFDREIAQQVREEDPMHVVAIDVESGDFEVAVDELAAVDGLRARRPKAQIYLRRVGSPFLRRRRHWSRQPATSTVE